MKVTLIRSRQESAVITVDDMNAYIIDINLLPSQKIGATFDIEPKILEMATPYGIDLEVVFPEGIEVDLAEFQRKLFSYGIFSLGDLKKKPHVISQILVNMIGGMSADIYRQIKIVMEDYNDSI